MSQNLFYILNDVPQKSTLSLKTDCLKHLFYSKSNIKNLLYLVDRVSQKSSLSCRWGVSKSVLTGDYILAVSVKLLAETKDPEVSLKS